MSSYKLTERERRALQFEHVDRLIAKAIEDIRADRKGNAIGKLSAARGNLVLLEKPDVQDAKAADLARETGQDEEGRTMREQYRDQRESAPKLGP